MALAYILILYMSFQIFNLVSKHVPEALSNNLKYIVWVALNITYFENFDGVYIVFEQLL